jgi:hypothetical protein
MARVTNRNVMQLLNTAENELEAALNPNNSVTDRKLYALTASALCAVAELRIVLLGRNS